MGNLVPASSYLYSYAVQRDFPVGIDRDHYRDRASCLDNMQNPLV